MILDKFKDIHNDNILLMIKDLNTPFLCWKEDIV